MGSFFARNGCPARPADGPPPARWPPVVSTEGVTAMQIRSIAIASLTLALALAGCAAGDKDGGSKDKHLSKQDLPAPVAASVDRKFPGAQIRSVEKETENGKEIYDVELTQNGHKYEMDIETDGT